jgi:hypothetical protein
MHSFVDSLTHSFSHHTIKEQSSSVSLSLRLSILSDLAFSQMITMVGLENQGSSLFFFLLSLSSHVLTFDFHASHRRHLLFELSIASSLSYSIVSWMCLSYDRRSASFGRLQRSSCITATILQFTIPERRGFDSLSDAFIRLEHHRFMGSTWHSRIESSALRQIGGNNKG